VSLPFTSENANSSLSIGRGVRFTISKVCLFGRIQRSHRPEGGTKNEKRAGFLRPAFDWQVRHVGLSGATDFLQAPERVAPWVRAIAARVAGAMHCSTRRAGRGSSCEAGSRRLP
jgi:hypothetical protein